VTDPSTFSSPAHTIENLRGIPTVVTWVNELKDAKGNFLPHLLPVDPTLHWANPPNGTNPAVNGMGHRDSRPIFQTTPGPYKGPVPLVTHAHGIERVEDWADGYPEAWYLPAAKNIPPGFAHQGTWFKFFSEKANTRGVGDWALGEATYRYPNSQEPSTAWFHDHTLGMTHLNVYAGLAGLYIVRSILSDDNPLIAGSQARAVLPGPAPGVAPTRSAPTTKCRSLSRIVPSTRTARCSIPTRASSSTASRVRTSRQPTFLRSGIRSFSAIAWS
jgi:hypothetical protein